MPNIPPSTRRRIASFLRRFPFIMAVVHIVLRWIQPKFSVGVVGVIYNTQGQVLLVEHVFHAKQPWGLPGGWIKRNESPAACAQREILEELGLHVEVEALLLTELSLRQHLDFAYLCRPLGEIGTLSMELLDYAWTDPNQTPPLVTFHRRAVATFAERGLLTNAESRT